MKRDKTNWNEAIEQLKTKQSNTELVAYTLKCMELASCWITCACGNLCATIPRYDNTQPIDLELRELGLLFSHIWRDLHDDVVMMEITVDNLYLSSMVYGYHHHLTRTLNSIEKRSTEILNEIAGLKT